ncbi:hypothetical protein P9G68_20055, partial [Bacillus spizizenii]|uniref:hypothetical protein n=1 Tax=Bacillus spizizenii TaxID=96241 RepID=UPI002DB62EFA
SVFGMGTGVTSSLSPPNKCLQDEGTGRFSQDVRALSGVSLLFRLLESVLSKLDNRCDIIQNVG